MTALTKTTNKALVNFLTLVGCTLFLIVCSNFKIYTSFSPVPISMHTFAILVLGAILPFRKAAICFGIYLFEGFIGSPIFNVPLTVGASFGYLVGMMVALYFLSRTVKKLPLMLSLCIADLLILGFGVLHLQFLVGLSAALKLGVVPFIAGNAIKLVAAYGFIRTTQKKLGSTTI